MPPLAPSTRGETTMAASLRFTHPAGIWPVGPKSPNLLRLVAGLSPASTGQNRQPNCFPSARMQVARRGDALLYLHGGEQAAGLLHVRGVDPRCAMGNHAAQWPLWQGEVTLCCTCMAASRRLACSMSAALTHAASAAVQCTTPGSHLP
jgi:hypothetical protein